MLSFLWNFLLLVLQNLLLLFVMPSLKKTVEKVMGPSPAQRARLLNEELQRIRDEGISLRNMLARIIEERGARDAELLGYGDRMRMAGMLSTAELEVLVRAEDRLRRRGVLRGPAVRTDTIEEMTMEDLGLDQQQDIVLGPLRMVDDDQSSGVARSCSRCLWLGLFVVVLVLVVTGMAALLGALTRPYIL